MPGSSASIGMQSYTSATPSGVTKRVIRTFVSGTYIWRVAASPVAPILKRPPLRSSRIAANSDGESKRGRQSQSIEPFRPTSAAVCRSPMTPY